MKDQSKIITEDMLRCVYNTKGVQEIGCIQTNLSNVLDVNSTYIDCLKVYNIFMYAAPFIMCHASTT
jgi:hypothetical protein